MKLICIYTFEILYIYISYICNIYVYDNIHLNISYGGKNILMVYESFACNVADLFKEENDAVT